MQYTVTINQSRALEWGLNSQQAMLFAFVYGVPSWADPVTRDGEVFYALAKSKIVEELPLLTDKPDTAYRMLKVLQDKGLIVLASTNSITLVRLTAKAKAWNKKEDGSEKFPAQGRKNLRGGSEKNPSDVGKKSDPGSEKSPTDQDTSDHDTKDQDTSDQESALPDWLPADAWAELIEHRRQLKAPMNDLAKTKAINKLDKLRQDGSDPAAVIEQTIVNGWKGVFPVKANVHRMEDHRPRPKHTGLDQANSAGLTPRSDGTFSL
ncbi:hypothetical protein RSO41_06045 [Halomonas sp. I1]|uniref:hypothetical protein n=1 Tax=Halomonas sp. I1 TaxID=393536 RepID=UPI0028DDA236|nr:hypothetical protein [Halomonas sp. I1]MDT8894211.1 hypothetical protein [Halomonas sp. I1]